MEIFSVITADMHGMRRAVTVEVKSVPIQFEAATVGKWVNWFVLVKESHCNFPGSACA